MINKRKARSKIFRTGFSELPHEKSRGDRIRTCDHLVPNQVRYRTALRPESDCKIMNFICNTQKKVAIRNRGMATL